MGEGPELQTERLLLRRWRAEDLAPFAALNADPVVMEHFPSTLDRAESDELIARIERGFERDGYGFWAVEIRDTGALAGFVGISPVGEEMPFHPAVEIGWRLSREHWGAGIASEAARESARFGFEQLQLPEIVAFTAVVNLRSRRVMERLGMSRDRAADFLHPLIEPADPLAAHVLYRLAAPAA